MHKSLIGFGRFDLIDNREIVVEYYAQMFHSLSLTFNCIIRVSRWLENDALQAASVAIERAVTSLDDELEVQVTNRMGLSSR